MLRQGGGGGRRKEVRLLFSILRRENYGVCYGSNATINPLGREDTNNLRAWARMRTGTRMREGQDILLLLFLGDYNRCNRRDMETAATEEPKQTGCEYRDNTIDAAAMEEGPFGRRTCRCGPGGGGVGHDGRQRCRMVGRGAGGRHRGTVCKRRNTTINPCGRAVIHTLTTLIWFGARARITERRIWHPSPLHPSML